MTGAKKLLNYSKLYLLLVASSHREKEKEYRNMRQLPHLNNYIYVPILDLRFSLVIFNYHECLGQAIRRLPVLFIFSFIDLFIQFSRNRSITLHQLQVVSLITVMFHSFLEQDLCLSFHFLLFPLYSPPDRKSPLCCWFSFFFLFFWWGGCFVSYHPVCSSDQDLVICLYLKISEHFVWLILLDKF